MNYKIKIAKILDTIDINYKSLKDTTEFIDIVHKENNWLCNIEDKLTLLEDNNVEIVIKRIIDHLKNKKYIFTNDDIGDLEIFTSKINKIVKIADRLNNFKNSKLQLLKLFNAIKQSMDISKISIENYGIPKKLQPFLPHLYSVVKNCQDPSNFPIYYKFWKNIIREVLKQDDGYSNMCKIYNNLGIEQINKKQVYFGAYFGVIATEIAQEIKSKKIVKSSDSKEYRWVKNNLLNLDTYLINIISETPKVNINDESEENNGDNNGDNKMKKLLNQILYGPPGTGKTYKTVNKALEIIFSADKMDWDRPYKVIRKAETLEKEEIIDAVSYSESFNNDDREALNTIYNYFIKHEQIKFVTFHQSYGYEEFVEGIKPCGLDNGCDENQNGEIKYTVQAGIFKELSKKASQKNVLVADTNNIDFNDYLTVGQNFETKHGKKFTITKIDEDIYFEQGNGGHTALRKTILELLNDEEVMLNDEYYSSQVYMARDIYKQLNKNKNVSKNYILIIDEINRGNISKIFGELITLIEPSKRIGKDEEIKLTLPNSPDTPFGVPSNLYIIGTMNTADRSIAQIDTALRRRFVFEEMMPNSDLFTLNKDEINNDSKYAERKSDLIVDDKINIRLMLNAINERIEYIYDREHTIGHSYFMELLKEGCNTKDKLDEIFRINIIPLLAEYFYGDWGDIKTVLNDDDNYFITEKKEPTYIIKSDRKKDTVYLVNESFKDGGYENIYLLADKKD